MKLEAIHSRIGARSRLAWAGALALTAGLIFGNSAANAAPPPAKSRIGNQASASYTDSSNTVQLTTSNLVETTIQQVGSFTLDGINQVTTTVVNTKTGATGTTLYAPHTLINTGNGADTFNITVVDDSSRLSRVQVYLDGGNGFPTGPALCTGVTTSCVIPAQSIAGNNGVFQFLVAYTIPSSATAPAGAYDTATITVTPGTPALYTAPNTSAADKDQINLTPLAAFSVTKVIGAPGVPAPGNVDWPVTYSSGPRSTSTGCNTNWSSTLASSASCQYVVFTLNVNNTGGAAGKFVLTDNLPAGFTYVTNSAVWSTFGGLALGDGSGGDPAGISYQFTGTTLTAVIEQINPNVVQSISFVALVNTNAGATNTTNVAHYNSVDAPTATVTNPGTVPSVTNPVTYTVKAAYAILLGANPSDITSAIDTVAGITPNTSSNDTTTVASAAAGSTIKYAQIAHNHGDASDVVDLSVGSSTFPSGTIFTFFRADGMTPMVDTSGNEIPDTGPIAAGSSVNFVVRATLPANASVGSGPFEAIIRGTSVGDKTKIESTRDSLTSVIGSLVDLTNSASGTGVGSSGAGDLGPGPSPSPTTTVTTPAGTGAIFSLFVKNNDTIGPPTQTYTLQASQTNSFPGNLPANWNVKFVAAGAGCSGAALTTVSVTAGGQQPVDACVTPPSNQVAVTAQTIYFRVVSNSPASTGQLVSDTKTDAVTVILAQTYSATLSPSNNGQVSPAGSVTYAHTLTNNGTQSCAGPYTVVASLPIADTNAGWSTALSQGRRRRCVCQTELHRCLQANRCL